MVRCTGCERSPRVLGLRGPYVLLLTRYLFPLGVLEMSEKREFLLGLTGAVLVIAGSWLLAYTLLFSNLAFEIARGCPVCNAWRCPGNADLLLAWSVACMLGSLLAYLGAVCVVWKW